MFITEQIKKDIIPKNKINTSARVVYLDVIKILSAFLVVFYHISFYRLDYGFLATDSCYFPNFNRIVMSFSACSVPLFFMVNGALLFSKKRSWQVSLYKAVKLLFIVLCLKFLGFPSWFFITLSILYLLYPVFLYFYENKKIFYYIVLIALLVFPFLYNEFVVVMKIFSDNKLEITGAKTMYSIVYFFLGNILFNRKPLKLWQSILLIVFGMAVLSFDCIVLTNSLGEVADGVNGAFPTVGALLTAIGVFEFFKAIKSLEKIKIPSFFSDGILTVYLFHLFVNKYLVLLVGKPENLPFALVQSVLVFIVCCLIGYVLKKIPVLCFFSKI